MNKREVILDLASSKTWKRKVAKIIDEFLPEAVQREIRSRDYKEFYSAESRYLIGAFAATGEEVNLENINCQLKRLFENEFTHWRGYHSCRPRSLDRYMVNGILPLTRDFVISEAIELFRNYIPEQQIRKVAMEYDLRAREGDICLFADPFSPLEQDKNHYLRYGGEILQCIACKIALCRGILMSQGKPFIIQCKIPIQDVKEDYRLGVYRNLVTHFFQNEMSRGAFSIEVHDYCLRTSKRIAPENIEKFIQVDDDALEYGFSPKH